MKNLSRKTTVNVCLCLCIYICKFLYIQAYIHLTYTSMYPCACKRVYLCAHILFMCVCTYIHFIWKPKYHWKRERLKAGRLVYLEGTEDEQQRGCRRMSGEESSLRERIRTLLPPDCGRRWPPPSFPLHPLYSRDQP